MEYIIILAIVIISVISIGVLYMNATSHTKIGNSESIIAAGYNPTSNTLVLAFTQPLPNGLKLIIMGNICTSLFGTTSSPTYVHGYPEYSFADDGIINSSNMIFQLLYIQNGQTIAITTSTGSPIPVQLISSTAVTPSFSSLSNYEQSSVNSGLTTKNLNLSENNTLNTLAINKSNVLFGIPNQFEFEQLYYNVNVTSNDYTSIYGLNFTTPIMNMTQETSVTYSPVIPPAYLNITYPVALYITISTYTAAEALNVYNDWYSPNSTGAFTNGTYYVNASGYFFKNASEPYVLEVNVTRYSPNIGNLSTAIDIKPISHLDDYQVSFVYGGDLVTLLTYGIIGKYNYACTDSIAKHIYNLLSNTT
jgi:hypothetical protein